VSERFEKKKKAVDVCTRLSGLCGVWKEGRWERGKMRKGE
jgi:hypothetical protein